MLLIIQQDFATDNAVSFISNQILSAHAYPYKNEIDSCWPAAVNVSNVIYNWLQII